MPFGGNYRAFVESRVKALEAILEQLAEEVTRAGFAKLEGGEAMRVELANQVDAAILDISFGTSDADKAALAGAMGVTKLLTKAPEKIRDAVDKLAPNERSALHNKSRVLDRQQGDSPVKKKQKSAEANSTGGLISEIGSGRMKGKEDGSLPSGAGDVADDDIESKKMQRAQWVAAEVAARKQAKAESRAAQPQLPPAPSRPPPENAILNGLVTRIGALVKMLKNQRGDAAAQASACSELATLASMASEFVEPLPECALAQGVPDALDAVLHLGLRAVLEAMEDHRDDERVQEQGFIALTCHYDDFLRRDPAQKKRADRRKRNLACVTEAMKAVMEALEIHRLKADLQCKGLCTMLKILFHGDSDSEMERRVKEAGGVVDAAVKALKAHEENADVQGQGCRGLLFFCHDHDENKRRAVEAGGVEAVVKAIKTLPQLQSQGCTLLAELWFNCDDESIRCAGQDGGWGDEIVSEVRRAARKVKDFVPLSEVGSLLSPSILSVWLCVWGPTERKLLDRSEQEKEAKEKEKEKVEKEDEKEKENEDEDE